MKCVKCQRNIYAYGFGICNEAKVMDRILLFKAIYDMKKSLWFFTYCNYESRYGYFFVYLAKTVSVRTVNKKGG